MHSIFALWTVPRSVSTAFERMMAARGDLQVINEPFSPCYYFGPDAAVDRYRSRETTCETNVSRIVAKLRRASESEPVFFKDMPYHVRGYLTNHFLDNFQNSILIRHPQYTLTSLFKKQPDFTEEETGFARLERLVQLLYKKHGKMPPIIDGEALRADPVSVVRAWCAAVGLEFRGSALQWDRGPEPHWQHWSRWFQEAADSRGFQPPQPPDTSLLSESRVARAYEQCLPIYERLAQHRIA